MNKEAREILDRLVNRDPEALTTMQIAFLRARHTYLTKEEVKKFKNVLFPKKTKVKK